MERNILQHIAAALVVAIFLPSFAAGEGDLSILTFPIGLVVGEQSIDVDLGASAQPAELYLDGEPVCSLTAARMRCVVDFGEAPHVHLLELIRRDDAGRVTASARRWVNRPGQEADLAIQLKKRDAHGMCDGRLIWLHPLKQDPVVLEVEQAGVQIPINNDGRSFRFPCPESGEPLIITASVIFPGGSRAEAVVVPRGFGNSVGSDLTAMALESTDSNAAACRVVRNELFPSAEPVEEAEYEIVFVLAPGDEYTTLYQSGWSGNAGGNHYQGFTTKRPKPSWRQTDYRLRDAERLWFVVPDERLSRMNGFENGTWTWLMSLVEIGSKKIDGRLRVADAVAASGLVAAAGPHRRALVLVLGTDNSGDESMFSPEQARSYLAEIGVPFYVLRMGAALDDGWPSGVPVENMGKFARALKSIKNSLDDQCVAWFPGDLRPDQIAATLPHGLAIAGRGDGTSSAIGATWQRSEVIETPVEAEPVAVVPVASERIEVTAVRVLISARGQDGGPVTDLSANDLKVEEDGRTVPVLGLEPVGRMRMVSAEASPATAAEPADSSPEQTEIPVTIYVDRQLSGSADIIPALNSLRRRAARLTMMGPVDVVVADFVAETVLEGASDPVQVAEALRAVAARSYRGHAIERIRAEYLREARSLPPNRFAQMALARRAIFEEDALVRGVLARLNDWALSSTGGSPRLLFVVGLGFDEDPIDFYERFLVLVDPSMAAAARGEFLDYHQAARVGDAGRELAAAGWLVTPIAVRVTGKQRIAAEFSGDDIIQAFKSGVYVRDVDFMLMDPLGSQRHLAEASGGKVVMGGKGLDKLTTESAGWYRLTYQVSRAPDGDFHELKITSTRPDVKVKSTEVVLSGTSEGRAAKRIRELLDEPHEAGELPVTVAVGEPQPEEGGDLMAETTVTVAFDPIAPLFVEGGIRALRFSFAVLGENGKPFIHHQLETAVGRLGGMRFDVPIRWSKTPVALAVVVEDLGSGAWGGAVQRF